MFSGIVEELGIVAGIDRRGAVTKLSVRSTVACAGTKIGDSIAVNGVCLTVVSQEKDILVFDVMQETFRTTTIGDLHLRDTVNLERALLVGSRVSGHFVLGHVDCVGTIRRKSRVAQNLCFEIAVPVGQMKYILPKGSVAVDGISLTVQTKKSATFSVYLIPHTLENTTLSFKGPSSRVNVEFDILAKK